MKKLPSLLFCLLTFGGYAQENEEMAVKNTIEAFFKGFHRQDSVQIKKTLAGNVVMQTIAKDEMGNPVVKTQASSDFLKSIVAIPETTKFEEVINSYSIQIDGPMAHAWTPYTFNLDGSFHHCGVNSFQLVKDADKGWQIVYVIDTRRKGGCK
ncbi:hypothetical protein SAMN05421766_103248 [Zobellia uliginosa]|uniref:Lumazine-binding n=1 Tax=Zobellia uliginosa TaxID=143224 RepID=A0ABY1KVN7_9FLAO|nr:3-methyl-2-oxobutanoate hydroxymethyltransferase [Zobellia uliginosa]SIS66735.1 hypothetical protein SAMN05421766_103248 [Zobellia uliginosa]